MKVIITYNQKGVIKSSAFLAEGVEENLEFEPKRGERLMILDSSDLPEDVNDSAVRPGQLAESHRRIREKLQVKNGKVVGVK